jgi:hypothetical protein
MKKKEALNYIKLHKGYIPYINIFEIYDDEHKIPQELINMSIKKDKPIGNFIICSAELAKQFKNLK